MPGKRLITEKYEGQAELPPEEAADEADVQAAPPRAAQPSGVGRLWLIPVAALAALVLVYAGFCVAAATRDTITPHTLVGELDVSGMTRGEARRAIGAELDALLADNGIRVTLEDGSDAAFLSYRDLGVTFNADAITDEVWSVGHSGSVLVDGWTLLRAAFGHRSEVWPEPVSGWTVDASKKLAEAAYLPASDFSWEVEGKDTLRLTKARDGREADQAALRASLLDSSTDAFGERVVPLPYTVLPGDPGDLQQLNEQLGGEMANARYDAATNTIIPERAALNFDVAQAQAILDAAAPGETVVVPAVASEPTVTAEELRKVLFRDVLSSYTTRVGGAAGRKSNVKLTAARVNGTVLNSGDEFNYYALTGPFTAANGYMPAPGYLHGKTVEMDGGGACQCSSTTYAAALLANLEIVARTAHGFASDYIGLGLDATVSGGGPDFIFRNNTPYPIKVVTSYSENNRLTVTIIGTKTDDTTVRIRTDVLSTTPFEEEIVEDPTLEPGARVVDTTPYTGYTVNTYRQIYDGKGNLISETFEAYSKYNKRNRIIHVGPAVETPPAEPADPGTGGGAVPVEPTPIDPSVPVTPTDPPIEPPVPVTPPEVPDGGNGI